MSCHLMSKALSWGLVATSSAHLIYSLLGDISFGTSFTGPPVVWAGLMFLTLLLLLLMNAGVMLFMRFRRWADLRSPLRHFVACLGIAAALTIAGLWIGEIRVDASRPAEAYPRGPG